MCIYVKLEGLGVDVVCIYICTAETLEFLSIWIQDMDDLVCVDL